MFRIGEFSKLTQVSKRMLRHYDEVGLLKPVEVDAYSAYRMYSIEQIPLLNKIIYLRDSGFQIAEIADILKIKGDRLIIAQLDKKYAEVSEQIRIEETKRKKIEIAKHELIHNKNELHYQIAIKYVPSYLVLSLRKVIPNYYAEGELWKEMTAFAKYKNIEISNETFSIYHDEEYREEDVDVELCVGVAKSGKDEGNFCYRYTEAIPLMASTMVYGPFTNIAQVYLEFAKWLQENSQYAMIGTSRQIVHRGPWNESDPSKYLIEVQIPLQNSKQSK